MSTTFRERVKGLAYLPKARIEPAALNFRIHDDGQRAAFRGLAEEIGIAGAALAWVPDEQARAQLREVTAGDAVAFGAWLAAFDGPVRLFDGHMRREEIKQRQPVLVTDLDEREALVALASFDALGAQAARDAALLRDLLGAVGPVNEQADALLADLREAVGFEPPAPGLEDAPAGPDFQPGTEEQQGQLDASKLIECPACGHKWNRWARGQEHPAA